MYRSFLVAALVFTAGCYSYVPTEVAQVSPSQKVRITLEQQEASRLLAFLDARSSTVTGEFLGATGDSVRLVLRTPLAFQEVSIPRASVADLSVREADRTKNLLVSAALVGAVGVAAYLGFEGRGGEPGGPGPQPDESLVPLFSFGLPLPFGR